MSRWYSCGSISYRTPSFICEHSTRQLSNERLHICIFAYLSRKLQRLFNLRASRYQRERGRGARTQLGQQTKTLLRLCNPQILFGDGAQY
jgi:hypothetical protein